MHRTARLAGLVLCALLAATPLGTGAAQADTVTGDAAISVASGDATSADSTVLFDPTRVLSVDLGIEQTALDALAASPREYVAATITVTDGDIAYGPYDVGVKLKGHTSFRDLTGKAAFRVKFSHVVPGQRLFGLKGLTLNNMVQDPSMIAEAVTYSAFRGLGVPAARSGYAFVRLNGNDYGLYANVETIDTVFAARWFASTGHVYEGESGADVTAARSALMQVSEGSAADTSDLTALVAAADSEPSTWLDSVDALTDLDQMLRAFAVEHYTQHWDGYSVKAGDLWPTNYYLHTTSSGVFSFIPSGTDQALITDPPESFGAVGSGVLFNRCISDRICRQRYVAIARDVSTQIPGLSLGATAQAIATAIAPWTVQDPRKEVDDATVLQSQADRIAVIDARPAQFAAWLQNPVFAGDPPPAPPTEGGAEPPADAPSAVPAVVPASSTTTTTPVVLPPATTSSPLPVTPERASRWTRTELAAISARQFGQLPRAVLAALTARQAGWLTPAQLRAVGPVAIRGLSPAALRVMTVRQLVALRASVVARLTRAQIGALEPEVASALIRRHGRSLPVGVVRLLAARAAD